MTKPLPDAAGSFRGAALTPTRDCDVCIVGDDVAGLLIACDLAAAGYDVVLVPAPDRETALGLDGTFAPGFALAATALVDALGPADAAEAYALSVAAARRGLMLAEQAGVTPGPRGRLAVTRQRAAPALAAEHALLERLAPQSGVLLNARETAALLGIEGFAAGLGLVPACRVDAAAFHAALSAAAAGGDITMVPRPDALVADLHGLRKYVTTPHLKVRAYQVVLSGASALRRIAPEINPSLVLKPWVSGRIQAKGAQVPYGGAVDEAGATGLRWHWDGSRLALAAETATLAFSRAAAARVLRRHAAGVIPNAAAMNVETARGCLLAHTRRLMPLIQEGGKGIWYCITGGAGGLAHGVLGADLICRAIIERDDRIRLFQPFGLEQTGARPVRRWVSFVDYWRKRLTARLSVAPAGNGTAMRTGGSAEAWSRD